MKKKIMYALMFTLICICAIVIGKIKFSGTEKQQPSSLVSETDNLKDSESNFVEEETERSTQKTAEEQEIILEKETTSESPQTETAESQQTDLVNQIDYALTDGVIPGCTGKNDSRAKSGTIIYYYS